MQIDLVFAHRFLCLASLTVTVQAQGGAGGIRGMCQGSDSSAVVCFNFVDNLGECLMDLGDGGAVLAVSGLAMAEIYHDHLSSQYDVRE